MKKILVSFFIIIVTITVSSFPVIRPDAFFISTIFTVSGIMFSIGLGLIATFNLSGVKNPNYIKAVRNNINYVRNNFIKYFLLTVVCYVLSQYVKDSNMVIFKLNTIEVTFSFQLLFCILITYCIIYFVINFLEIQKLNNDIFDRINDEENK